jgi:hypothetical protein
MQLPFDSQRRCNEKVPDFEPIAQSKQKGRGAVSVAALFFPEYPTGRS